MTLMHNYEREGKTTNRPSRFRQILFICGLLLVLSIFLPNFVDGHFQFLLVNFYYSNGFLSIHDFIAPILGGIFILVALISRIHVALVAAFVLALMGATSIFGLDLMSILSFFGPISSSSTDFLIPGGFSRGRILTVGCIALSAGFAAIGGHGSTLLRRVTLAAGACFCCVYYLVPLFYPETTGISLGPFAPPYLRLATNYSGSQLASNNLIIFLAIFCYWAPGLVAIAAAAAWWRVRIGRGGTNTVVWYAWALRLVPLVIVLPVAIRAGLFEGNIATFLGILKLYLLFGVAVVVAATAILELLTYPVVNVLRRLSVSDVPPVVG